MGNTHNRRFSRSASHAVDDRGSGRANAMAGEAADASKQMQEFVTLAARVPSVRETNELFWLVHDFVREHIALPVDHFFEVDVYHEHLVHYPDDAASGVRMSLKEGPYRQAVVTADIVEFPASEEPDWQALSDSADESWKRVFDADESTEDNADGSFPATDPPAMVAGGSSSSGGRHSEGDNCSKSEPMKTVVPVLKELLGVPHVLALIQLNGSKSSLTEQQWALMDQLQILFAEWLSTVYTWSEESLRASLAEALLLVQTSQSEGGKQVTDIFEHILEGVEELCDSSHCCLHIVDRSRREIWTGASTDPSQKDSCVSFGRGIAGHVAECGEVVNVCNATTHERYDSEVDNHGMVPYSVLCIPVPPPWDDDGDEDGSRVKRALSSSPVSGATGSTGVAAPAPLASRPLMSPLREKRELDLSHISIDEDSESTEMPPLITRSSPQASVSTSLTSNSSLGGVSLSPRGIAPSSVAATSSARTASLLKTHSFRAVAATQAVGSRRAMFPSNRAPEEESTATAPIAVIEIMTDVTGVGYDDLLESALVEFAQEVYTTLQKRIVEATMMRRAVEARNAAQSVQPNTSPSTELSLSSKQARADSYNAGREAMMQSALLQFHTENSSPVDEGTAKRTHSAASMHTPHAQSPHSSAAGTVNINMLKRWDVDPWALGEHLLPVYLEGMFRYFGLLERFDIPQETLRNFIMAVKDTYHANPFHNFFHAFSVVHITFLIMTSIDVRKYLTSLDILALLVSTLCHDMDHTGHTNAYEIATLSDVALTHGDDAVLERHHAHMCFKVLTADENKNNILEGLSKEEFNEVRKTILKVILATDMSKHVDHCKKLSERAAQMSQSAAVASAPAGHRRRSTMAAIRRKSELTPSSLDGSPGVSQHRRSPIQAIPEETSSGSPSTPPPNQSTVSPARPRARAPRASVTHQVRSSLDNGSTFLAAQQAGPAAPVFAKDKPEDRLFLCETIMHCADLSGQVLPTHIALEWGRRILNEFNNQAREEIRQGLPASFVVDSTEVELLKGQLFFLSNIISPLWEPVVQMFPQLSEVMENLKRNTSYYNAEIERLKKQEEQSAAAAVGAPSDTSSPASGSVSHTISHSSSSLEDDEVTVVIVTTASTDDETPEQQAAMESQLGSGEAVNMLTHHISEDVIAESGDQEEGEEEEDDANEEQGSNN